VLVKSLFEVPYVDSFPFDCLSIMRVVREMKNEQNAKKEKMS
jgi:hypothetical protein